MTDEILRKFEKEISAIIERGLKDLKEDLTRRIAIEIYYLKYPLIDTDEGETVEGENE